MDQSIDDEQVVPHPPVGAREHHANQPVPMPVSDPEGYVTVIWIVLTEIAVCVALGAGVVGLRVAEVLPW